MIRPDDEEADDWIPETVVIPIEDSIDLHLFRPSEIGDVVEGYLDAYLEAGALHDPAVALFQSVDRARQLTGRALSRGDVLAMIKRRAATAGLPPSTCCHTFRATGITAYLSNGGTLEHAQQIAAHASPKTTKLYDRTADTISLDEIERIVI